MSIPKNTSRKKKTKQTNRKAAVKQADIWFSRYIRKRDGNRCVTCGATKDIQCGHVLSRAHYGTRWDERNAFAQCAGCNILHEYDPWPLINHFIKEYSERDMACLHDTYSTPTKYTTPAIIEVAKKYESEYNSL
jgi:hypothetical protein